MTDLSDFGVDVTDPADEFEAEPGPEADASGPSYPNGRCPAITSDGRRRCRAPVSRMNAADGFCGTHGRQRDRWTIHDDPEWLIELTGGRAARCRAIMRNGERCTSSCGPLDYFCGTHEAWSGETVDELDAGELDVDLIRAALGAIGEADGP